MIAKAIGANVVAVDIADDKLALARDLGAVATINANSVANVPDAVIEITGGGAHVSVDALGHPTTCFNSIQSLRRRGKHIQIGLMLAEHSTPPVPMAKVVAHEPGNPRQPRHTGAPLRCHARHDRGRHAQP